MKGSLNAPSETAPVLADVKLLNGTALAPMTSTRCSCMLAHTDLLAGEGGSAATSANPLSEPATASH
jgi:hypothetical protein